MHRLGLRVEHALIQVTLISVESVQLSWYWRHDQLLTQICVMRELAYVWVWVIYEGYLWKCRLWSLAAPM